jgi:hypothetical protein
MSPVHGNLMLKMIQKINDDLKTDKPTRVIILIPNLEGKNGNMYDTLSRQSKFAPIAVFEKETFPLVRPEHFMDKSQLKTTFSPNQLVLFLAANRASLKIDPIDWEPLSQDLLKWSKLFCKKEAKLCPITEKKFGERVVPDYPPRATWTGDSNYPLAFNAYHYFDFSVSSQDEKLLLQNCIKNPLHLDLIADINRHDRLAGSIGILPNSLIKLIKITNSKKRTPLIILDLRMAAFWSNYLIWIARVRQEKIPPQWKRG